MKENRDIFDRIMSLRLLYPLYPFYSRYKEQLLYLFFGALTTLVNLLTFWLCLAFLPPLTANVIAWIVGVVFAYGTNRTWVFSEKAHEKKGIAREVSSFTLGRLATLGMEELVLWLGISILGISALVIKIIAQLLVIIGNYVISKWIVFKKG